MPIFELIGLENGHIFLLKNEQYKQKSSVVIQKKQILTEHWLRNIRGNACKIKEKQPARKKFQ